jgi:4-hydroxy-tetrahydrodipicolinate synthase
MKLEELKQRMRGVFIIVVTPFQGNEDIDYEGLRANLQYLLPKIEGKDFSLTPCGSFSEFYAMSDEERKKVLEVVADEVGGKLPLLAGTACPSTRETINMCKYAESLGYDGAQIVLPFYFTPSEEGMYQHYKAICNSVGPDFGIQIYNNPHVAGCWVKPHLLKRISKIPKVICDKENSTDVFAVRKLCRTIDPADMSIIEGVGEVLYSIVYSLGVKGFVSSFANVAPDLSYELYQAGDKGDTAGVRKAMERISLFFDFREKMNIKHGPTTAIAGNRSYMGLSVLKKSLQLLGLASGTKVRGPITEIDAQDVDELKGILREMDLPLGK